jgi:two-component system cell cycle sensor histidine kinase/response regulator CckA
MRKPRILVVDDERVVVEVLTNLLEDPDRELLTADCAAGALEHARAGEIEVALVDKNLGADSGLELSRALKQAQPELEVILITGYASIESAIEAVQIGAFDYLTKPIADFSALSFKVQSALEKSQLKRSQRALLERLMECEVRHRRLIDAAPEAIVLYDAATGLVVEANEAAVKLYGYSPQDLLRAPAADLRGGLPEGTQGPAPVLQRHRRRDGSEFTAEVTFTEFQQQGRTLRVQSARDVSEREQGEARRRELEERLRAAQRLDALGRLASGVSQDFGALLSRIASHAGNLAERIREQSGPRQDLAAIAGAVARAAALTRQLELFSRRVPGDGQPRGKGERILLVQDEQSLREMVRRMLASHGYEVVDAGDAEEGLRVARERKVDLLLTELTLPRVDGPGLLRQLLEVHPAARVLYISDDPPAGKPPPEPRIQRPFTPVALLGQVRRALDA